MSDDDRPPAALLAGRFRVGELLGTGGSASVFAAVDTHTGSDVALKILHPHLEKRAAARAAFFAEARRAQHLIHPNIARVIDVAPDTSEEDPAAWIALEQVPGVSLAEFVAAAGALEPVQAVSLIQGVLQALEAVHERGLVHRDVTPANIMVSPGSSGVIEAAGIRLLDFGLAAPEGSTTLGTDDLLSVDVTGRAGVIGNVNYLSPEHARGDPVDRRGDIYQAGAVLFFALTGRPPFPRENAAETMQAHLVAPPPVPSVLEARIPRGLDRIVVRAMLKDPADRFPSATAMREAVAELGPSPAGGRTRAGVDAGAPTPGGGVPDVTRVLGRTTVPPRSWETEAAASAAPDAPRARGPRLRTGAWFVTAAVAALVIAVIVVSAANSSPTASLEPQPSASAPTRQEVAPSPASPPTPSAERGDALLPVPDLARLTLREAELALASAGLTVGAVSVVDAALPRDTVLASSPAAGDRLSAGSAVTLTVASGYNLVPDVAGQGRDAAAALVQAAGFAPSFAYRTAHAHTLPGSILGTDPGPGTLVAVGTPITVLEAAPAAPSPQPTSVPTSPATPTPTATSKPGQL